MTKCVYKTSSYKEVMIIAKTVEQQLTFPKLQKIRKLKGQFFISLNF